MATPSVRMTIQIPADLYDWLEPLIQQRRASQFIVELLERERNFTIDPGDTIQRIQGSDADPEK